MKQSTKFPKHLVFLFSGLFVIVILGLGKSSHARGGIRLFSNLFTGSEIIEQTFSQSMPAKAETDMDISHSHGYVTVKGWDKDEVKLEGRKIVKAKDKETARMYAEQMKVEMGSEGVKIVVKTIRPERDRSWEINQITINYELYAPKRLNITLKNVHGNVFVESFTGKLKVNSQHGTLQVAKIGQEALIDHEHGNVELSQIGGSTSVNKRHGDMKINSVGGELKLYHEHGTVDLAMIGRSSDLTKRHGRLSMTNVDGKLKLDHEHGDVQLKLIGGDLEMSKKHGNIDVQTVNGNVSIYSEHGNLRICDVKGDVHLRGAHGNADVEDVSGKADVLRSHCKVRLHNVKGVASR